MNWYFYWYFTIYSIYKRFSKDSYFDIFATSMFSFFIANLLFSVLVYLSISLNFVDFIKKSSLTIVIPYLIVFVVNYMIFLPKQKQLNYYKRYMEVQNSTKNFVSVLLSVFSLAIFVIVIIQGRKYLMN